MVEIDETTYNSLIQLYHSKEQYNCVGARFMGIMDAYFIINNKKEVL